MVGSLFLPFLPFFFSARSAVFLSLGDDPPPPRPPPPPPTMRIQIRTSQIDRIPCLDTFRIPLHPICMCVLYGYIYIIYTCTHDLQMKIQCPTSALPTLVRITNTTVLWSRVGDCNRHRIHAATTVQIPPRTWYFTLPGYEQSADLL